MAWQMETHGGFPFWPQGVNKIRILGVYFSNGLLSVDNDNWQSKLDKLSNVLNLWKQRDLSFVGRALIVNVLGASKLWHVAKVSRHLLGCLTNLNLLFGLSFGIVKLNLLVDNVAAPQLNWEVSTLSISRLNLLPYVYRIFKPLEIPLVLKSALSC